MARTLCPACKVRDDSITRETLTEVVKPDSVSPRCSPAVPANVFCTTCPATVLV